MDFDEKTKEVLVEVDKKIVKKLKPHQGGGIKFMWDAVFESKEVCVWQLNARVVFRACKCFLSYL